MRFDVSAEIAQPQGDIADRQDQAKAFRVGWLGANLNHIFSMGGSFRFIMTEPKQSVGVPDRSEIFLDMVGIYLRVAIPVATQFKGFIEADPSLVGMHVPCEDPSSFTCNGDGFEFGLRFGMIGRAGAIYEAIPHRLDLYFYGSYEKTFPEEGGWLTFGAGLTAHFGPTHAEIKRRQQWQQQMMQQQYQQPQQGPYRPQQPPQQQPPPPPPPSQPPPPPPAPDPYR